MACRRAAAPPARAGQYLWGRKSKAVEVKPEDVTVAFKEVGGADEAIAELQEIIQFLKAPEQFADSAGASPRACS